MHPDKPGRELGAERGCSHVKQLSSKRSGKRDAEIYLAVGADALLAESAKDTDR